MDTLRPPTASPWWRHPHADVLDTPVAPVPTMAPVPAGPTAPAGQAWTGFIVHGSFTFATCRRCEWTGAARRAEQTAQRDAVRHRQACPGSVAVTA